MAKTKKKKSQAELPLDEKAVLYSLQLGLAELQRQVAERGRKVLVVFEGRDAAGKGGTIRRITENLPPRMVRAVSLPAPSEREKQSWYFQRFVAQFPAAGEIVLFDRSWYNRAGVEPVMGFCTEDEHQTFLATVADFESLLMAHGVEIVKYYLDISKKEQKKRLKERAEDPLKRWKIGPLDAKALNLFDAYSEARDEMFTRTHTEASPWTIVRADSKSDARLNLMRDLITRLIPGFDNSAIGLADPKLVFRFEAGALTDGRLAH